MREFKFRAWDQKEKKMYTWEKCIWLFELGDLGEEPAEPRIKFMQYAGLKDKKGREIYEGDILQQKEFTGKRFLVIFDKDGIWMVDEIGEHKDFAQYDFLWRWAEVTQIIGNKYENQNFCQFYNS